MELQFGANTPRREDFSLPLDQAQKSVHIVLKGRNLHNDKALFTTVVRDPDAPHPDFIHLLVVNSTYKALLDGNVIVSYYPPQREGHRYMFEIYKQAHRLENEKVDRVNVDFESWANEHDLTLVDAITVTTQKRNPVSKVAQETFPITERGWSNSKYCRCILKVHAKNMERDYHGNAYAICTKSTREHQKTCGDTYDLETMPLKYLLAYADLSKLNLSDPTNRDSVIKDIKRWKMNH